MNPSSDMTCETLTIDDSDLETILTEDDDVQMVGTIETNKNSQQNGTHNKNNTKRKNSKVQARLNYKDALKDSKLLIDFVEKCLQLDPKEGMSLVIHKTLIPIYLEADKEYVKSRSFEKYITKHLITLNTDPNHKFTHLKTLCDSLKLHKFKKRAKLITLSTISIENSLRKRKHSSHINKDSTEIIDLVNENEFPNNTSVNDHKNNNVHLPKLSAQTEDQSDQSNNITQKSILNIDLVSKDQSAVDNIVNENASIPPQTEKKNQNKNLSSGNLECEENGLLVPRISLDCENPFINGNKIDNNSVLLKSQAEDLQKGENISRKPDKALKADLNDMYRLMSHQEGLEKYIESMGDEVKATKILEIEQNIACVKEMIARLEEEEVCNDSEDSPYIVCNRLKENIVNLYKFHCKLTGSQVVKRRVIRLQVSQGHPAGPVRRLEEFLNNNIGEDGDVPFPDLDDVIFCVMRANVEDGLRWQKTQIEKEARSLFIQCGRALQKRRQEREWRDLLCKVKLESCDEDPADNDPQLLAKLERNRILAAKKEHYLLQQFTRMQDMGKHHATQLSKDVMENSASHNDSLNDSLSSADHNSPARNSHLYTSASDLNNDSNREEDSLHTTKTENYIEIEISSIPITHAFKSENESIEIQESNVSSSSNCAVIKDERVDNGTPLEATIKDEPTQDVVAMLNDLGDNYTTTVLFDLDDPQLVIEISDSSDDESL